MITSRFRTHWIIASLGVIAITIYAAAPGEFKPDQKLTGSTLTGWSQIGSAAWKLKDGELTVTPSAPDGGWLLFDRNYQDVDVFTSFRAEPGASAGVIVRAKKEDDGSIDGVFVSLTPGDVNTYRIKIDSQGREVSRTQLQPPVA